MLLGRKAELARVERLLREVRAGRSQALVITGEAGVGKTALLEHLVDAASGCRVARVAGVQAEAELAFGALHQLCTPLLDQLDLIPEPQRDALGTVFGLRSGPAPDPFLLGVAVLSLVAGAAAERPLVCVIDDAQWLDRASSQVMGFVARRLMAESVAFVFARRSPEPDPSLAGLPEMVLDGLPPEEARALLAAAIPGPLDQRVRDRIVAETRGNPLAILELPHGLTRAELTGGFGLSSTDGLSGRIEESFRRRLGQLSSDQRRLALLAAAEPLGDPALLCRGAERLDLPAEATALTGFDGLLEWGTRVTFRHPLVRSATYGSASAEERREAHRALAEVTDPASDGDRRAWHMALAATGPDERVAGELERSAGRAQARGGFAAAAGFLERAAMLTSDPAARSARFLAAAEAKHRAGAQEPALRLLAAAQGGPLDDLQRARGDLLRAQVAHAQDRGPDTSPLLLRAAGRLEALDVTMARDTYLEALSAAQFAGRMAPGAIVAAAQRARRAPTPTAAPRATDLLLDGLAVLLTDGYPAGVSVVRQAVARFVDGDVSDEEALRWTWLACRTALDLWDFDALHVLADRTVELARGAGLLAAALPFGLTLQAGARVLAGDLEAFASINEELDTIVEATGSPPVPYAPLFNAAWQGGATGGDGFFDDVIAEATARGEGQGVSAALMTRAVYYNGVGRHEEALATAERGSENPEALIFHNWSLVELVEAAAHCRQRERAIDALDRLATFTQACGTDWALGIEARSRAQVSDGDDAEGLHREAISRLGRTRARVDLGRAHLLYGEWLRRERRRLDAREELRRAHDMLSAMGVEAFAERARRELLATGETARTRTVDTGNQLTAREAQIAQLARDGLSNPEIGTRLFLSPRTVEYHLRKVFTKLAIASRTQLDDVLDGPPPPGTARP